ncbi:MAG: DUF4254 domain-containing protein [Bacteroidota bacterium]
MKAIEFTTIFNQSISDYHLLDNVNQPIQNPFEKESFSYFLYQKNWIDTVQWHYEDLIRNPQIEPADALLIKRKIDQLNQQRTDLVEQIDDFFYTSFHDVTRQEHAVLNTESPAWAIDRLSILCLKIYHMRVEVKRTDASASHIASCEIKLQVLEQQFIDLTTAIDQLLEEYASGKKFMKVYRQVKMYNDPNLNPVLYTKR